MVIELTKISQEWLKTIEELKQSTGSQEGTWMDKTREDLNGLHLGKLEKHWPDFFCEFISVYIKMLFTQLEDHSHLLCGHDFAIERL